MIIRARFPALVDGRTTKMRGDKLVFCLPETDFEISEVEEAHAPVAVVTDTYYGVIPYRYHEGRLYTPLKDSDILSKLARVGDVSVMSEGHPVFGDMVAEIRNLIGFARDVSETRPERLYNVLGPSGRDEAIAIRAGIDALSIVETPSTVAALAKWSAKASKRMAEFVLIDGRAWQVAPEPCYRLDVVSGTAEIDAGEVFRTTTDGMPPPYGWDKLHDRYYSALDTDLLDECVGRLVANNRVDVGSIEVMMPEALKTNFRDREIDRFSRVCVDKVEKYVGTELRRDPNGLREAPLDLLMTAAILRDRLASREPHDEVSPDLAEALSDHAAALDACTQVTSRMEFEDRNVVGDIASEWLADVATRMDRPLVPGW